MDRHRSLEQFFRFLQLTRPNADSSQIPNRARIVRGQIGCPLEHLLSLVVPSAAQIELAERVVGFPIVVPQFDGVPEKLFCL